MEISTSLDSPISTSLDSILFSPNGEPISKPISELISLPTPLPTPKPFPEPIPLPTPKPFPSPAFQSFNPKDNPLRLVKTIVTDSKIKIDQSSAKFTGGNGQTSFYNGSLSALEIDSGILLTSGDGTPPQRNTQRNFSVSVGGNGDRDLDRVATSAFKGAGKTFDGNLLEFSFNINDSNVKSVTFDLVFGSDEFPEFSNTSFVDVAGVFVNGKNYALFNSDPLQPLSIINNNLNLGNFKDNKNSRLPIEYDGVSGVLKIVAPVKQGKNTVKFGTADTGDRIYDSGLFISNLSTTRLQGDEIGGLFANKSGGEGNDSLTGSEINEFIDAGGGNDIIDVGSGNNFVDAGTGDDIIFGGKGNNQIDGGDGTDTVVFSGNKDDFNLEKIGDAISFSSGASSAADSAKISGVEFLSFDDVTISTSDLQPVSLPENAADAIVNKG
ncbi:MAG: choice-of-anchor L domain-containing protein [Cyanobacteria bacterium J06635_10]